MEPEWIDSNNCNMDLKWVGQSDEAGHASKEACQSWCTDPARGSEFELEEDVDMCCAYEAWNNEAPFCSLMVGGIQEDQTEDLENAVFSSLVFQFDTLEEYEESEWEEDYEDEEWDEEDWEDMYGCDFESFCWVKIGGLHLFCKDE